MKTIIYDFETSGLNPYHADVTEIGCKCIDTDEVFTCLVQPLSNQLVDKKVEELTGITNLMLKKQGIAPLVAYQQMCEFLHNIYKVDSDITLVAHNGTTFDDIFLKRMHRSLQGEGVFKYDDMFQAIQFVDSLLLSRLIHPERYSHSMHAMCMLYNITNKSAHRAQGDVDALSELWTNLLTKIKQKHSDTGGPMLRYLTYC